MSRISGIDARVHSGSHHMTRPELQGSVVSSQNPNKKNHNSVEPQSDFDMRNNSKSSVVLKSNQKPTVSKLLKSSTKEAPASKMLSVVRGVKNHSLIAYLPAAKQHVKDQSSTRQKTETAQAYSSKIANNSVNNDEKRSIMLNLKVPSKAELSTHLHSS